MQVKYFPKLNPDYSKIAGQDIAFAVLLPDVLRAKNILEIAIHGVGERSGGTLENLKNLVEGFDYNNDGIREAGFVTPDMKKAVDLFGIIMIIPTYENNTFFEPAKINQLYDYAKSIYSIYDKMALTGFSLGGEAVIKYITSSLANASRVAYAIPCAAPKNIIDAAIPGSVNLPVHCFHNDKDDRVDVSNTLGIVADLNKSNPALKALYTIFRKDGHGGNIEAWSLTPPKAPNGQGFIDAAENIYQVVTDVLATGKPRQMKSGAVIQPTPTPSPVQPAQVALTADFNMSDGQVITTTTFDMDASNSTGVKPDWDGYKWDVKPVGPAAGKQYGVRADGAYGGPKKKLIDIVDGQYEIVLTVRNSTGSTAQKKVVVTAKIGVAKTVVAFDSSTDIATYSDGSTEKATAVLKDGKWTIKNSAGQIL